VDKFSKYSHFLPLSHPFTAFQVAQLFLNNIFKLHGQPSAIVSDRDKVFTSTIWKELFKLLDINLRMSSAYHPQMDGQTERVNQCLETYLRCFVHTCPTKWHHWLPMAEYWYNTSYHSSLGKSPFLVLYGHEPRHFGIDISQSCQVAELNKWLTERELMQHAVCQHLIRAQNKMKLQADKHRSDREFQQGDSVYLKAQPYVQTSLANRSSNKLAFRFFGPFDIIDRIGQSSYKLKLPDDCLVHPVFHVSQLKCVVPPHTIVSTELPDQTNQLQLPVDILERRLQPHNGVAKPQVLVQWSHLPPTLTTWEDEDHLCQEFLRAPAWGQAGTQGRGSVTDGTLVTAPEAEDFTKDGPTVDKRATRAKKKSVGVSGQNGLTSPIGLAWPSVEEAPSPFFNRN
jgi:hypothetical protein